MVIDGNYIHDLLFTRPTGMGSDGIFIWANEGAISNPNILVSNNILRRITGVGENSYITSAIYVGGSYNIDHGIDIIHNSIYLSPDHRYYLGDIDSINWTSGLIIESGGPTGINVINNIFHSAIGEHTSDSVNSIGSAIWCKDDSNVFGTIEANQYFSEGQDTNVVGLSGTSIPPATYDLEQWRAFTGQETHSGWGDPQFTDEMLHILNPGSPALAEGIGFTNVTEDYSSLPRHSAFPSRGAHEPEAGHVGTWTGTHSHNWNDPVNWAFPAFSVPDSGSYIYIHGDAATFPELMHSDTGRCRKIVIGDSAHLTIRSGGRLETAE
jgi:hypothetical protein